MTVIVITNKRVKVDILKKVDRISQAGDKIFISVFEDSFPVCHSYNVSDIDEMKVY